MNKIISQFSVSPFGLLVSVGLLIWLIISLKMTKKLKKRNKSHVTLAGTLYCFAFSVPVGLIFARLFWCISNYYDYLLSPASIYKIWEGGLSLWGFILGFWITTIILAKKYDISGALTLDAFSLGLTLFIAILRASEVFTGQGVGRIITYDFLVNPLITVYDVHGEARFAVYRLEAFYALILFLIMLSRVKKHAHAGKHVHGDLWRIALAGYAMAQIAFESMRDDDYMRFGFVRVSQAISILILLIFAFYYVYRLKKTHLLRMHFLWMIPLALSACAFVIYEEFRVDAALNTEKEHLFMLVGAFFLFLPSLFATNKLLKRKKRSNLS